MNFEDSKALNLADMHPLFNILRPIAQTFLVYDQLFLSPFFPVAYNFYATKRLWDNELFR